MADFSQMTTVQTLPLAGDLFFSRGENRFLGTFLPEVSGLGGAAACGYETVHGVITIESNTPGGFLFLFLWDSFCQPFPGSKDCGASWLLSLYKSSSPAQT